ncbi:MULTISPECIES: hypothetical protein [Gammaproteobacteria]|uniref:hypothetical protein n=1 Tax=Gammaproteobacteria TaxID=1236 RepID=UPI0021BB3CA9|nr:hypothetical protein [Alishewanella sp. BS5-314]MCT8127550.1 hypothetical protein [Alishewanella sp. BS5-314]
MHSPFLICQFAKETLSNLVRERFGDNFPDIVKKQQVGFIYNYLKELNATSILLESEYVDRDYLEDYSRYYVKCFNRYGERCARLHFFSSEILHSQIEKGLMQDPKNLESELQNSYLGFMVIKPLPKTFIGKTCLKVYPRVCEDKNKFILHKPYNVNLFGLKLSVNSIPFQEQDKVVSACATTAIWSLLHAQKHTDRYGVPSSSEITLSAINHIDNSSNSFPNKGLSNKQILRAIDVQSYRNHKFDFDKIGNNKNRYSPGKFFEILKPYLDSGIPMLLGCDVYSKSESNSESGYSFDGSHAVTILGYKNSPDEKAIYIHDDRFGPYAKAIIHTNEKKFSFSDPEGVIIFPSIFITLHHKNQEGHWSEPIEMLVPDSLIIPTNPKIRLPLNKIINTCDIIAEEFSHYYMQTHSREEKISFDIKLITLAEFRDRIISDARIDNRYEILTKNSPRFLWVARFFGDGSSHSIFEIAFDATDIPQGEAIAHLVVLEKEDFEIVKNVVLNLKEGSIIPANSVDNFFPNFVRYLQPEIPKFEEYLNKTYGAARAPLRLKPEETLNGQLHTQSSNLRKIFFGRSSPLIQQEFPDLGVGQHLIWAISIEGALLIGHEVGELGHPTLTGYKFARISGELHRTTDGWAINAKSGRYSGDYLNQNELLSNARLKFMEVFYEEKNMECSFYMN